MKVLRLALCSIWLLGIPACGESSHTLPEDSATPFDSGTTMGTDSGTMGTDSGTTMGTDSGMTIDTDSGITMDTDSGTPIDVDGGAAMGVMCGTTTCTGAQFCCVMGAGGMPTYTCTDPGGMCMGVMASCDGPEDCMTGDVCCGSRSAGGATTECLAAASCMFRLCHTVDDCPMGQMCRMLMGGASFCSMF